MSTTTTTTWKKAMKLDRFVSFEDPVCSSCVMKAEFDRAYGPFLITLDGGDEASNVEFYFQESPIRVGYYEFVDEDARLDFFDGCKEFNLLPSIEEIQSGEDEIEKQRRIRTHASEQGHHGQYHCGRPQLLCGPSASNSPFIDGNNNSNKLLLENFDDEFDFSDDEDPYSTCENRDLDEKDSDSETDEEDNKGIFKQTTGTQSRIGQTGPHIDCGTLANEKEKAEKWINEKKTKKPLQTDSDGTILSNDIESTASKKKKLHLKDKSTFRQLHKLKFGPKKSASSKINLSKSLKSRESMFLELKNLEEKLAEQSLPAERRKSMLKLQRQLIKNLDLSC